MTKRSIGLAVAASLMIATGCKKDSTQAAGGSGAATGKTTAEAPDTSGKAGGAGGGTASAVPAVAMPKGVDRLLAALPMESEIVFGIDIGRLRSSALVGPFLDAAMKANSSQMGFDMKAECGIDPAQTVGMAVVGIKMTSANSGEVAIAMTGMDKAKVLPCMEKMRSKIEANGLKLTIDGDYAQMVGKVQGKDAQIGMMITDDGVAVLRVGTTPVDKAVLAKMAAARGGDGLTGSKEFMGMVGATNTAATLWVLANGGAPLMQKAPVKFKSAFGSIDVTDGVVASGRLRMATPDEAANVAKMFGGQLNSVKQMGLADVAEMKPDGSDVVLTFTMKPQQVETLKNMASMALQSMTRGMGGPGGMGGPAPAPTPSGP